ncbi:hypothetical protein [Serinicoccus sp. CUA-874]|uniref:hypothetical protein n=1 Tax=Serinicoccus sp. CUA-874 TaxID=1517939 RepID=UPI00192CF946|nr:hypothetical protein [Serinicoccus sp. CUA-874]
MTSAAAPDTMVAAPVTCPRCPFGTVRPCTSLAAMEHRHRASAKSARARSTASPAMIPSSSRAAPAIATVARAWPPAPTIQTRVRRRCATTHGVRAACGSMDPDSRIGTSSPTSAAGAPTTASSQGSTVLALTTWSPMLCRAPAAMSRTPPRLTRSVPPKSSSASWSAETNRWYHRSHVDCSLTAPWCPTRRRPLRPAPGIWAHPRYAVAWGHTQDRRLSVFPERESEPEAPTEGPDHVGAPAQV